MKNYLFLFAALLFISITEAQNIGIGTTTPPARFTVIGLANNPAIPGNTSSGVLRIGLSNIEGIDIGKSATSPYAGWIQSGFNGIITDPLSLQPVGGNVGIGTTAPGARLEVAGGVKISDSLNVSGQLRITSGAPGAGKVLTSDVTGLASWITPVATTSTHAIGDSYGGGIVFYVYDNGQRGLIAAPADQSAGIVWWGGASSNTNAIRDGIGAFSYNTEHIIATQGAGNYAAMVCAKYNGGGYGDWYLPAKYELNLLFLQKTVVGGFTSNGYWSSTELDTGNAWAQLFSAGLQGPDSKTAIYYVRAIRAF